MVFTMRVHVEELNNLVPYSIKSYSLNEQGFFDSQTLEVSMNTYCTKNAQESTQMFDVLLYSPIDFFFPILEEKYMLADDVATVLIQKGKSITIVSASFMLLLFCQGLIDEGTPEACGIVFNEVKDRIKIVIPFYFYTNDEYSAYEMRAVEYEGGKSFNVNGIMNFKQRLDLFARCKETGVNILPAFNPDPFFSESTRLCKADFYEKFPEYTSRVQEIESINYIVDDVKQKIWDDVKKASIVAKLNGIYKKGGVSLLDTFTE